MTYIFISYFQLQKEPFLCQLHAYSIFGLYLKHCPRYSMSSSTQTAIFLYFLFAQHEYGCQSKDFTQILSDQICCIIQPLSHCSQLNKHNLFILSGCGVGTFLFPKISILFIRCHEYSRDLSSGKIISFLTVPSVALTVLIFLS